MSRPAKPARVLYYIDADVLGLAKILAEIRGDVTYPGDPGGPVKGGRVRAACTVKNPATLDEVWIPETAHQGWLIITRDKAIQDNRAEIEAVRAQASEREHQEQVQNELVLRFEQVAAILRDLDIKALWAAAEDAERRVLIEELVDSVTVFPDHLEVTVGGAPPLNVLYSEVGLKESENVRVGGGTWYKTPRRVGSADLWLPAA